MLNLIYIVFVKLFKTQIFFLTTIFYQFKFKNYDIIFEKCCFKLENKLKRNYY